MVFQGYLLAKTREKRRVGRGVDRFYGSCRINHVLNFPQEEFLGLPKKAN